MDDTFHPEKFRLRLIRLGFEIRDGTLIEIGFNCHLNHSTPKEVSVLSISSGLVRVLGRIRSTGTLATPVLESVNPRDIEASVNPDDISQIDGDVAGQLHESLAGGNGIIGCFNFCHRWIGHTKQHVSCVASRKNSTEAEGGRTVFRKDVRDFGKF